MEEEHCPDNPTYTKEESVKDVEADNVKDVEADNVKDVEADNVKDVSSESERCTDSLSMKRPYSESDPPSKLEDEESIARMCLAKRIKLDTAVAGQANEDGGSCDEICSRDKLSELVRVAASHGNSIETQSDGADLTKQSDMDCHAVLEPTPTKYDSNKPVEENCLGVMVENISQAQTNIVCTQNETFSCDQCSFQTIDANLFKKHCTESSPFHSLSPLTHAGLSENLMIRKDAKKQASNVNKRSKKGKAVLRKYKRPTLHSGGLSSSVQSMDNKEIVKNDNNDVVNITELSQNVGNESSEDGNLLPSASKKSKRNPGERLPKVKPVKEFKSSNAKLATKVSLKNVSKVILNLIARRTRHKKELEKANYFRQKSALGQVKTRMRLTSLNRKDHRGDCTASMKSSQKPNRPVTTHPLPYDRACCPNMTEETNSASKPFVKDYNQDKSDAEASCHYCKHVSKDKTVMEKHFKRQSIGELSFYCQPCGYYCMIKEDFGKHYQSERHAKADSGLICYICNLIALDETIFETHMKAHHYLFFHCPSCKTFFTEQEDLLHHKTPEHPICGENQENNSSLPTLGLQTDVLEISSQEVLGPIVIDTTIQEVQENVVPIKECRISEERHCDVRRSQFQCKKCFYKTRSSTVLTRHIKLRHARDYHFLCKACNIYSMCKEGMEKHIKRSKHIQNAKKNNIGLLFEECIEKVWFSGISDPADSHEAVPESESIPLTETIPSEESFCSGPTSSDLDSSLPNAPRRGRPKGNVSRMCPHCGLLASSVTNLAVHIRRKHSHQYNYLCKVCNYYTVTKGDMERHCTTKKHESRIAEEKNDQQTSIIVISDGTNFEAVSKKKGCIAPAEGSSARNPLGGTNTLQEQCTTLESNRIIQAEHETQNKVVDANINGETTLYGFEKGSNKCAHCDFIANSGSSLEVHLKNKHSKELVYYCIACEYYAVTLHEMAKHASTEKHKIKHHNYQSSSSVSDAIKVQTISEVDPKEPLQECLAKVTDCLVTDINSISGNQMDKETGDTEQSASNASNNLNLVGDEITLSVCKDVIANDNLTVEPNTTGLIDKGEINCDSAVCNDTPVVDQALLPPIERNIQYKDLNCKDTVIEPAPTNTSDINEQAESSAIVKSHEGFINDGNNSTICVKNNNGIEKDSACEVTNVETDGIYATDNTWGTSDAQSSIALEEGVAVDKHGAGENGCQLDSSIVKLKYCDVVHMTSTTVGQVTGTAKRTDTETKPGKRKKGNLNSQGESTRIRCDDCGFLADGLSGLNVHIAMKHPTKEKHFHCLLCGKSFYTESNLHQHLSSVGHLKNEQASFEELPEGGTAFKCVKCTEHFDSEQSLFLHIKEEHEELLREVNKYIEEDTEQINREREENQGNVCKYCGKICKSSNSMAFLAHIRTHTGSKPFKCKICHFAAAQLGDARYHVKRHLGMREYKCHVCGVAFVMKKHLNTHLLAKHGIGTPRERKFSCTLCDRSFRERWALNNHMKLHTGEKPFKCTWPTCHYSFLTASAMKDHYRTHTGEKSFLCDLCGFAGGTRHALTKHRRQHTGEKPFKCDECEFASTTQSHLTRHKRVHTGEKPYRCPWCEYRSNCAENVRKHILHTGKHEGVKMYNCPKCDYATNAPAEFRNHLKEQHLDIENPDLAYLHAGIVSKSFECRLKGQGANFVESTTPFTASTPEEPTPCVEKVVRLSKKHRGPTEQVQQVIIIQGFSGEYDGDYTLNTSVEETAAATLQTLAMAGQVARVVHITEDGQVIATDQATHIPARILSEHLPGGATQVVLVEGPMGEENVSIETVTDSSGNVVQQVMTQGILDTSQTMHTADSSALDALLCAVTELGNSEDVQSQCRRTERAIEESLVVSNDQECGETPTEVQVYHEIQEGQQEMEPMEVVRQVMRSSRILTTQESAQAALKKMVQGVLQFAVCDTAAAGQLMQEGVTQVIVNDEGTVHMVSTEGRRIIMHNTETHTLSLPHQHMDILESGDEISEIIVTEELVQAMAETADATFHDGTTHYIVTELPHGEKDPDIYSHTLIETDGSEGLVNDETAMDTGVPSEDASQEVTSMVVYT
uniref:Zinc finger protein 407 n=1 Tax=Leptobrachium leishanense TaxID=445787 RepID=A0A8C5PAB5_9ANUR